jgi:hypothetical protein
VVKEVYKAEYAKKKPTEWVAFAKVLLKSANETRDDPADKLIMYREAGDFAAKAGDLTLALQVVDAATRVFAIPPLEMKVPIIDIAAKSPSTIPKALVDAVLGAVDDAVRIDDYLSAARLLRLASTAADRPGGATLSAIVTARSKEIEAIRKAFESIEADVALLKSKPDDAAVSMRIGRFYCLSKGDWDTGLTFLARGDDAKLKEAAEKDLANPKQSAARVAVGDLWWDLGEALTGVERTEARLRACGWYKLAPELTGLTKARVDKRLQEMAKVALLKPRKSPPAVRSATVENILGKNPPKVSVPPGDLAKKDEKEVEFEYVIDGKKLKGKSRVLTLDIGGGQSIDFVRISKGEFMMGSADGEADDASKEKPQHKVNITKDFYLGRYEVTQAQYQAIMGANPSHFKGERRPVEVKGGDHAIEFCKKVSERTKQNVVLPTEAQWEYACRAGTTTTFSIGSTLTHDLANFSSKTTRDVGSYPANPWGLYDMHGNVWEVCSDRFGDYQAGDQIDPTGPATGPRRVIRGGCWRNSPPFARSAHRNVPANRDHALGFRAALILSEP